jgi:hypothetical protein
MVLASSLRSFFVPTKMMGISGRCPLTSSIHYKPTISWRTEEKMKLLLAYLFFYIFERILLVDAEANEDDVCVNVVRESKTFIVLLASRVDQREHEIFLAMLDVFFGDGDRGLLDACW